MSDEADAKDRVDARESDGETEEKIAQQRVGLGVGAMDAGHIGSRRLVPDHFLSHSKQVLVSPFDFLNKDVLDDFPGIKSEFRTD